MTQQERERLIERYAGGADEVAQSLRAAFELFRAVRANNLPILRAMSEDDWRREGKHSDSGVYGTKTWLTIYAAHAHDHAAQIRRLREAIEEGA